MRIMFTVGSVDRYVDRYIGRRSGRHSIDTRSTVDRHSVDCRSTLGRHSVDSRWIVGRYVCRPILLSGHRYLADTWPTLRR